MWVLNSAVSNAGAVHSNKDICTIVYSETTQVTEQETTTDDDGNKVTVDVVTDIVETHTVKHQRSSFDGKLQTDSQWHKNIKGEIVADLSGLNKLEPALVDITAKVNV